MQSESYNILEIKDVKIWDNFIASRQNHTFLHSWAWGEFNEVMGDKIWRLALYNGATVKAVVLIIKVHARRGDFLFIPHGPIGDREAFPAIARKAKELANQAGANFIRISPLTPAEDELLMHMRKTTRNLIRRAQKEGVEIKTGTSDEDVEVFYDLYKETVKKHNFTPFSLAYIKNQVKIFSQNNSVRVFTARHKGQPLASSIIMFYGDSAFYHHGASIQSKIPAAYLLQWEAIREAKRRGHKFYNFWGIIKEDVSLSHPWQGITLFKKGFGGFQSDYLHAQDMPLSWKYWINWTIETIRKKVRHL